MRSFLILAPLLSVAFAAPSFLNRPPICVRDPTLDLFLFFGKLAVEFCEVYDAEVGRAPVLPVFAAPWAAETSRIKSACSCIITSTSKFSTHQTTTATSSSPSISSPTTTSTSTSSIPSTTSSISSTASSPTASSPNSTSSSSASTTSTSETSTSSTTSSTTISSSSTSTSPTTSSTTTSFSSTSTSSTSDASTSPTTSSTTTSSSPTSTSSTSDTSTSSTTSSTTTSTSINSPTSTTSSILSTTTSTSTSSGTPCTATVYSQIAPAVASCTAITLLNIHAPTNSTIDLSKLKAGSVVTFAGTTTFDFTNSSTFNPISIGGKGITIQGASGHVIDGNGQAYWDGQGSNGGVPKPDHFIVVSKVTANSVIQDLQIQNYPTHCFSISNCADLTMQRITIDNSAGDAPNTVSNGLPAAHNSDGFDVSTTNNSVITSSTVTNQDDCVAITSGNNIQVSNMACSGGHGMSIGSVGGKSNNNVTNILFTDSTISNSQNGARIKSNFNTTGFISNITYSNIAVSGISIYGIDVQQDYLNGGPTGNPSNGVIISNLLFQNITGTATSSGEDYFILCGDGSCSNFQFVDVAITGGGVASSCNYPSSGCPGP